MSNTTNAQVSDQTTSEADTDTDSVDAAGHDTQLIRGVGLTGATTLNMIDMIGVGPFITIPLIVAAMGGPQAMLGWIFGAILVMCDGLVWAELGAALLRLAEPLVHRLRRVGHLPHLLGDGRRCCREDCRLLPRFQLRSARRRLRHRLELLRLLALRLGWGGSRSRNLFGPFGADLLRGSVAVP